MKFHMGSTALVWLGFTVSTTLALFEEDAGVLDFTIATTGHGVTDFVNVYKDDETVLTTDIATDATSSSSCYVASRTIADGTLVWRRQVCATTTSAEGSSEGQQHATAATDNNFYTMDQTGVVRGWTKAQGQLLWDAKVESSLVPKIFVFVSKEKSYVGAASDGVLTIIDAETGHIIDAIHDAPPPQAGETAQWLSVINDSNQVTGILAYANPQGVVASGNRVFVVQLQVGNDKFVSSSQPLKSVPSSLMASSMRLQQTTTDEWHALAIAGDGSGTVQFSLNNNSNDNNNNNNKAREQPASLWNPMWTQILSIHPTETPSLVRLQGTTPDGETSMAMYRYSDHRWEMLYGNHDSAYQALGYCAAAELVIAAAPTNLQAYHQDSLVSVSGDMFVPDGDVVAEFAVLECTKDAATFLLSTARGSTTQLTLQMVGGGGVTATIGWTAEEGLATVSSALVLDASHLGVDDLVEERDAVLQKLSLPSRLASQFNSIMSVFTNGLFLSNARRDHLFGFVKVAAVLSPKNHRVWGIHTSGEERGSVRWSVDLPSTASWHTMVHGTTNSVKAIHGINGGTHSREILTLSASPSSVEWKCIDGTNGAVHAEKALDIASPIIQVIPVYGGSGGCRQASLLFHEDRSLSVVPDDQATIELAMKQLQNAPNGLFTHFVDKASSRVESFQVDNDGSSSSSSFVARQVGRTSFAGERIAKVAYPIRDEVVQTMSTTLGDDSLLLKYLNPHLAAVITFVDDIDDSDVAVTNIASSIDTKKTRKPAGAGDAVETAGSSSDKEVPNMFVNLIDTVSGRVLHRSSHFHVDPKRDMTVLISENWVMYTYVNSMSRRTELGVLTLHEGMIHRKALTLFSSPEQTTSFSSLDSRESKPVVLAKTYTYPKAITALGSTSTRGGISSRKILIASNDGKITSVDRHMLETRRPVGEVKEAEKTEGLFPYKELIPEISIMALTYNHTIESVRSVVAAPTSLESQSLVFAFGGPDLFFTRTSPSKGFDLLPDSFSRVLVSIVTVGIVIGLIVVQRLSAKKNQKLGWL